jgi:hypothetical protein
MPVDRERFAELEQIIEHGLGTFVEVGRALLEIQQRRLYRAAGHRTFADYVAKRWDLSSAHAYRQIDASKVVDILSPTGEMPLPANEAQARELAPLVHNPEAVRAIWMETIEHGNGRVTARAIRERVSATRGGDNAARTATHARMSADHSLTCPACGHTWSGERGSPPQPPN